MDLSEFRKEYAAHGIDRHELLDQPLAQFKAWFEQAKTAGVIEPNAMVLSTLGLDGFPSSRTVLLKAADERGFSFFTNYDSKKGEEPAGHPAFPVVFLGASDSHNWFIDKDFRGRIRDLFRTSPPWQPAGGLGLRPE
jgi:pyridoxamine 5'-phosphate oxidase